MAAAEIKNAEPTHILTFVPCQFHIVVVLSILTRIKMRISESKISNIKIASCKLSKLQQTTSYPQNDRQTRSRETKFAFWSSQQAIRLNDQPIYECQTESCIHTHSWWRLFEIQNVRMLRNNKLVSISMQPEFLLSWRLHCNISSDLKWIFLQISNMN